MAISTATREQPSEHRSWFRGDAVLAAGLVLIAIQLVWRFDLIKRTYFRQDDFFFVQRGLENDLTWDYLIRVDYGHLSPGTYTVYWLTGRISPYNDVLTHAITIGLMAAAGLALLRLLRLIFGSRPIILIPLAFYLLTPMAIPALSWWGVAIGLLPFQLAVPLALHAHVVHLRTGRFKHALVATAWTVFAMFFYVKAPFIPILMLALTFWFRVPLRRFWKTWLLYAGIIAVYAAIYFRLLFTTVQLTNDLVRPSLPPVEIGTEFVWLLLTRSLIPTMLGGPWRWAPLGEDYAIGAPPDYLVWASGGVAAAALLLTLWYRRKAWLAWLVVVLYFVLADIAPVLIGRISQMGSIAGLELRYIGATAMVIAIFGALAFVPVTGEDRPWLRPWPSLTGTLAGPVVGAFVLGSIWSASAYAELPLGRNAKSFIETARVAMRQAPKDAVLLDMPVPTKVVYAHFFLEYSLASRVLGPIAPPGLRWTRKLDGQFREVMSFDPEGRLRPMEVVGLASTVPKKNTCQKLTSKAVRFPFPGPMPKADWVVQIVYLNAGPGRVSVTLDGLSKQVAAGDGLVRTFTSINGAGDEVQLRSVEGDGVCVSEVKIGSMQPSSGGAPVPAQPVDPQAGG